MLRWKSLKDLPAAEIAHPNHTRVPTAWHFNSTITRFGKISQFNSIMENRITQLLLLTQIQWPLKEWKQNGKWAWISTASPIYWPLKVLHNTRQIQPFTHFHIHWWRRPPCKVPTAHQEQLGVQYFAQGHFDMQLGGAGILPPDPQPPIWRFFFFFSVEQTLLFCPERQVTQHTLNIKIF